MATRNIRKPRSYKQEEILLTLAPILLQQKGFAAAESTKVGPMKFLHAKSVDGHEVVFWVKQAWYDRVGYAAVQVDFLGDSDDGEYPDAAFISKVTKRVASAVRRGATHALLLKMEGDSIVDYIATRIQDITRIYERQIEAYPRLARNTKSPTIYFSGSRSAEEVQCAQIARTYDISLEVLAASPHPAEVEPDQSPEPASKKVTIELERRLAQGKFRQLLGEHFQWRCAVTGNTTAALLDAAHLPGRDWRFHNTANDGVLLRCDLHRALDANLAEIRDGTFLFSDALRGGEYEQYHGKLLGL